MRSCSLCHAADRPELIEDARCNCSGEGEIQGHSFDCQKIEHYVQRDIKLLTGVLTKKQRRQGWVERPQGFRDGSGAPKPAIERFICRRCVVAQEMVDEVLQFKKKVADESDPDKVPTMYQILSD